MTASEVPAWETLADQPLDLLDALLLAEVAQMFDVLDPVPPQLAEQLRFAISLDALEYELAELVSDGGRLVGARTESASTVQTLTFSCETLTIMVNVGADGLGRKRVDGWLAPGSAARIELHQGSRIRRTVADGDGRFVFTGVDAGLGRFVVLPPDGQPGPAEGQAPVATTIVEI